MHNEPMNKLFSKIGFWSTAFLLLSGCATTTRPGVVGVNREQFMMVPAAQVEGSAAQGYGQLQNKALQAGRLVESGSQVTRLNQVMQRLSQQVVFFRNDRNWQWQVMLIDTPQINAACLPGGKMIFYTGLLNKLQLTDAEIAAVMSHEMAHALREHVREQISLAQGQNLALDAAVRYSGYNLNPALLNQVMQYSLMLPHSREAESEADRIGLEMMARAGYDPRAALTLYEKMGSKNNEPPEFFSTHPAWTTRFQEINSLLPRVMPLYEAAPKPAG